MVTPRAKSLARSRISQPADHLYLYFLTVDGMLFQVHGLPGAESAQADDGSWTHQIGPLIDSSMRGVFQQRPLLIDVAARVGLTFQALQQLAIQLSRVPGRKNIVWITDGVPIALGPNRSDTGDVIDFTPQIRKLSEALDQLGVAIYPTRQVIFGAPDEIGELSDVGQTGGAGTGIESLTTLNEFAEMTGGRPNGGKNIEASIKQAMNDVRTSYDMGYYPTSENWDNKFHKIRVTCRRKGVRIQTKTGYYAWKENSGTRAQMAFATAASTAFDSPEIGLRADVLTDPQDGRVKHFDLHIDAHDIALSQEGGVDYYGDMRLMVIHYLNDGTVQGQPVVPLEVQYNPQEREQALNKGIEFADDLPVSHNGTQIRIIVFDRGTNSVGSLTIPDYELSHTALPALRSQ